MSITVECAKFFSDFRLYVFSCFFLYSVWTRFYCIYTQLLTNNSDMLNYSDCFLTPPLALETWCARMTEISDSFELTLWQFGLRLRGCMLILPQRRTSDILALIRRQHCLSMVIGHVAGASSKLKLAKPSLPSTVCTQLQYKPKPASHCKAALCIVMQVPPALVHSCAK